MRDELVGIFNRMTNLQVLRPKYGSRVQQASVRDKSRSGAILFSKGVPDANRTSIGRFGGFRRSSSS